jgi:hypothetical protein
MTGAGPDSTGIYTNGFAHPMSRVPHTTVDSDFDYDNEMLNLGDSTILTTETDGEAGVTI